MQKSLLVLALGVLGIFAVLASGCSSGSGPTPIVGTPTSFAAGVSTLVPAPTETASVPLVGDASPQSSPNAGISALSTPVSIFTSQSVGASSTGTPWVPPTALAGTPIPGAVATLTAAPRLKTETIMLVNKAGMEYNVPVEIADTPASQELGLMFRSSMDPDAGMLFDFGGDTTDAFWMENTILPLSVAFIKADGTIIATLDMRALDTTTVGPSAPYRYALETNQGYFAAHNLQVGDKVIFPGQPSAALPGMPDCSQAAASSK